MEGKKLKKRRERACNPTSLMVDSNKESNFLRAELIKSEFLSSLKKRYQKLVC